MALTHRSMSLENKELMALYGREKHYSQGCEDPYLETSDEGKGRAGVRSSVSLEIYGLQREHRERQVYFSNQEYCRRMEELKSTHLRNIAELERMYISQAVERYNREGDGTMRNAQSRRLFRDGPVRRLQRINSQEELDFHDTSSGSDQSELCGEESAAEVEVDKTQGNTGKECGLGRLLLVPDESKKQKPFRFQSRNPKTKLSSLSGVKVKAKSKATIPKPFQMMLREEERKRHKVRTRSEVELENTLLRRELEELRECKKQFRASPAPSHIHLPLYEVVSQRFSQRPAALGTPTTINTSMQTSGLQKPFQFLERERRKREAKIVTELSNLCPKEETHSFKARPVPRSMYGPRYREDSRATVRQPQFMTMERDVTGGQSDPNSDLESEVAKSETSEESKSSKCVSTKPVKKQIEVSIEMVKEKPWSYIDPLKTTCNLCLPLQPIMEKSEYISV